MRLPANFSGLADRGVPVEDYSAMTSLVCLISVAGDASKNAPARKVALRKYTRRNQDHEASR
jgi:hypothetical protein